MHAEANHKHGNLTEETPLTGEWLRSHSHPSHKKLYNWKDHLPSDGNIRHYMEWLSEGASSRRLLVQTDSELQHDLRCLARLLLLLRDYEARFGLPGNGGPLDRQRILERLGQDLYGAGAPIWALGPVLRKVAQGLTGHGQADFFMLPRRVIMVLGDNDTRMFPWSRGFCMQSLNAMERVAVRLASFATNTSSSLNTIPPRLPHPSELHTAYQGESSHRQVNRFSEQELAEEILDLASESASLFFFVNSTLNCVTDDKLQNQPAHVFWKVEESILELFSRLAAIEAMDSIAVIHADKKRVLYPRFVLLLFRIFSSAGACALWFNGSWYDMMVASGLAILVSLAGSSNFLSRHERVIFEVVISFLIGLVAGLIALQWSVETCFGAMAIAGVLDILQGFRIVYAIVEVMSRNTVTGGADFLESVLLTGLIAYFLKIGQHFAASLVKGTVEYTECTEPINQWWYLLLVPLSAVSWSGLFQPDYVDLPAMALHGMLGYAVSWGIDRAVDVDDFNNFVAAMTVTFSASLVSRFTGRQALGNTVAGLYVLMPRAYLYEVFAHGEAGSGFISIVVRRAIIIGIGSWTGTILCSPTIFGTNRGLMEHGLDDPSIRRRTSGAMIFF